MRKDSVLHSFEYVDAKLIEEAEFKEAKKKNHNKNHLFGSNG